MDYVISVQPLNARKPKDYHSLNVKDSVRCNINLIIRLLMLVCRYQYGKADLQQRLLSLMVSQTLPGSWGSSQDQRKMSCQPETKFQEAENWPICQHGARVSDHNHGPDVILNTVAIYCQTPVLREGLKKVRFSIFVFLGA